MHPAPTLSEPHAGQPTPVVSAEELHRALLKAFTLGNQLHRRFIEALRAMAEAKLYLTFGFSSIAGYSEEHFSMSRSQTYELLRVGEALTNLPRLDEAFNDGRVTWSLVREISRVATAETEEEWLTFHEEHAVAELRAEIRDAVEKKRRRPRQDSYGLPALTVDVSFKLHNDEYERVKTAFAKIRDELGESLGGQSLVGERTDWKATLLFLSDRVLETDSPQNLGGRVERKDSLYTLLYHRCPECRSAKLATADGLAEVPGEVVDRIEGKAKRVEISPQDEAPGETGKTERDRPNPRWLVKKVQLRDGGTCSNSLCSRRLGLHAHHIKFRSQGGKTALSNETLVCSVCHSLCHQGLLEIDGDPATGVRFKPRGAATSVEDFKGELKALSSLMSSFVVERPVDENVRSSESTCVDSKTHEDLASALRHLGYPEKRAREQIDGAIAKLESKGEQVTEETILITALRSD